MNLKVNSGELKHFLAAWETVSGDLPKSTRVIKEVVKHLRALEVIKMLPPGGLPIVRPKLMQESHIACSGFRMEGKWKVDIDNGKA